MSDYGELYQQLVLDHNKKPRNFRKLDDANRKAEGFNPLCGDHIYLYAKVEEGVIQDIGFQGSGCAISRSSASLMTESIKGKTEAEAQELFAKFHTMVTGGFGPSEPPAGLGKLAIFSGVREFPTRIKCASLAWHALKAALESKGQRVSTE